jgi:hypothetical protein
MNKKLRLMLIVSTLVISSMPLFAQPIPTDSLYLGQTPPVEIRKIFNLKTDQGYNASEKIAISPDGKEIYYEETNSNWTSYKFKYYKYYNNQWNGPKNLLNNFYCLSLSPDGKFMFCENNNFSDSWVSVKQDTVWNAPLRFLNTFNVHSLNVTNLNNYYLSSKPKGGLGQRDICKIIMENSDTTLVGLGLPLNSSSNEGDFFISNDESYIIVMSDRSGGFGNTDLFISFRKSNDTWTNPKNMGASVNTSSDDFGPYVTGDNKYLFYQSGYSGPSSIYWVKIDNIIENLKHTNFVPYLNRQITPQSFQSGQLCSYTVPDIAFIDDDGNNSLTYSATLSNGNPLPAWLQFDPATKTFTGTPTGSSNLSVKVKAVDNASASVTCTFTIIVLITGIEDTEDQLPRNIILNQNYPNPFNPTTTIEFAIPKPGKYALGLYNTLGELVNEISSKEYEAGYYKETLNATGLASGIYIYRLTGCEASIARKMVLLR